MDIVGPLPRTERGNKYILVISDYFTKWPEAFALVNKEAATIARVLVSELFARFGAPYVLQSDQGSNFDSMLIKEMCTILCIKKTRTTAYHPQCDGLLERLNRTLIYLIALNAPDAKENWDLQLGLTLMAYRSSVQSSTGFTPFSLVFGREMRVPLDIMFGPPPTDSTTRAQSIQELRSIMQASYEKTRERMDAAHKRQQDYDDRMTVGSRFKIGEKVWLYTPVIKKDACAKFNKPWTGPWNISNQISDVTYRILDSGGKPKVVHFDRLKKYFEQPEVVPHEADTESTDESEVAFDLQTLQQSDGAPAGDVPHAGVVRAPSPRKCELLGPPKEVDVPQLKTDQVPPAAAEMAQGKMATPRPKE